MKPTRNRSAYFLVTLCALTILGSLLSIALTYFFETISETRKGHNYYRSYIFILTHLGTLIAAVIMLKRKLVGLYLYTAAQMVYILTVISTAIVYDNVFKGLGNVISLFLVPSIAFMILYWLPVNRKHLT